ncbi:Endonuclease/exonuclease/phosphatase [Elaphomyces granulatus]
MAFISRLRTQFLSWYHDTPLADDPDATPIFQTWHEFDDAKERWGPIDASCATSSLGNRQTTAGQDPQSLVLVTWNVDSSSPLPASRISAIISRILSLTPAVDIIFLQEVSRAALSAMLNDARIRQHWFSSEADEANWGGQSFASMTLLSKERFAYPKGSSETATLGPVWRVKYPSRFERDALCCDIFVPSPFPASAAPRNPNARFRLVNVHLDSLPVHPSYRPRQVSIIASILCRTGRGVVAGDFNPVLPEDETLVQDNDLVDAWVELRHGEPGFTWGIDGKQPFPPNRLDKVATVGLKVQDIEVLHPESITTLGKPENVRSTDDLPSRGQEHGVDEPVPWSDHSGLRCSFKMV